MHVVVTGAAGSLGRYVANDLSRRGFDIAGIYRNHKPAGLSESIELIRCDLVDGSGLPDRFDAVFHAAATSPAPGVSASAMARDNVEATRNLVMHARNAGATRFLFCSSISVYGDITVGEVDEATPICDPDVYGLTKLLGEALVAEAAPELSGLSLRLPAVVGPGAARNFLAATAARLRADETVTIFNPDAGFNNAVHCADLAALAAAFFGSSWRGYEALVLGAGGVTTVRAAVELMRDRIGSRSTIVTTDAPKGSFLLRSARAVEHFGYSPMHIESMLGRFAEELSSGQPD